MGHDHKTWSDYISKGFSLSLGTKKQGQNAWPYSANFLIEPILYYGYCSLWNRYILFIYSVEWGG